MTIVPRLMEVRQNVLKSNDIVARRLRHRFQQAGVYVISLVSSPGSGKTEFLEKTLTQLQPRFRVAALVGDLATENDAIRLRRSQSRVEQIVTGTVCHLDASMVENALEGWDLPALDFLFIENVGNLVCPTSYDLGEDAKVVVLSVAEGEDKPLKYPGIFRKATLMILNKLDLLPYVPFNPKLACEYARRINPQIDIIETSATTGAGFDRWIHWLAARVAAKQASVQGTPVHQ